MDQDIPSLPPPLLIEEEIWIIVFGSLSVKLLILLSYSIFFSASFAVPFLKIISANASTIFSGVLCAKM
ncbi:hypothetical protein BD31_I1742, partial [Candidatus Nitrosopumilus salaria BD31]